MAQRELSPIHPGEILLEAFLNPMGITQYRLAKDFSVDPRWINGIVHGERGITADTPLRPGTILRNVRAVLVESAISLRSGDSRDPVGRSAA
jgi:addiction module HigA family antidote